MNKTTITLFSIPTIFVVLVIAVIALLIGNYVKNFNSGINLEPQVLDISTNLNNDTSKDIVWTFTKPTEMQDAGIIYKDLGDAVFEDYIILGILGIAQANSGYIMELDNVRRRSSRININYQIIQPQNNKMYLDVITYPQVFFKIAKDKLPVGVPLEFAFNNRTTKMEQLINQTLAL